MNLLTESFTGLVLRALTSTYRHAVLHYRHDGCLNIMVARMKQWMNNCCAVGNINLSPRNYVVTLQRVHCWGYGKWDRFLFFRLANLNVSQGHCSERDKDKRVVFWCSTFRQFFVFFLLCIGRLFPRKWNRLFVVHFFLLRWTTFNWQISHQLLSWDAKRSKTNEYKWVHINHKIITGPLFLFLLRILPGFSFLSRACYSLCQGWSALPCSCSREPWTLRTINIISMATD